MAKSSSNRINAIISALDYKSYLEIGVASGNTFHNVECEKKIAVDPKFRFDKSMFSHSGKHVQFFEMTSDEYFLVHPEKDKVDLIFLDGLHTFEQTYRDLLSSLEILSDHGSVILDDVYPLDFAGSLKSMREMLEYRTRTNDASPRHWWGDVYKVVFMVHDYHSSLDYRTCFDGKVQTIVKKGLPNVRKEIFKDITEIGSLKFELISSHRDVYKEDSLENVIQFLRTGN
jgi:hypothetical protein